MDKPMLQLVVLLVLLVSLGRARDPMRRGRGLLQDGDVHQNRRSGKQASTSPPMLLMALWKDLQAHEKRAAADLMCSEARGITTMGIVVVPHRLTDHKEEGEVVLDYQVQDLNQHPIRKARLLALVKRQQRKEVHKLTAYLRTPDGNIVKGKPKKKGRAMAFDVSRVLQEVGHHVSHGLNASLTFVLGVREKKNGLRKSPWSVFGLAEGVHGPLLHVRYQGSNCNKKDDKEVHEVVYRALVGNVTKI